MEKHTVLFWFLIDLCHQFLFYFGGVVAMGILIWEKWRGKPVQWKWISAFVIFCIFVSCFQAFVDEHRNGEVLISEKAQLVSDKNELQQKLEAKQAESDYLRDHQQIHIDAGSAPDPRIALILNQLKKSEEALKSVPNQEIRKALLALTKEMVDNFQKQKAISDAVESNVVQQQRDDFPTPFNPKDQAQMQRMRAQWETGERQELAAEMQMNANLSGMMMADYGPRSVALLEQVQARGESQTGISDKDLQQAINECTSAAAASYWGIQKCAERLSVIAQKMH